MNANAHGSGRAAHRHRPEEHTMWQLHASFRLGDYRTPELDVTPVVGITLIAAVVGLMIGTGL
jgi:hypothetical protein